MPRILIASPSDRVRSQLSRILTSSGFSIFRICASGSEIRRSLSECDNTLLLMAGLFPDTPPEDLLSDFKHQLQILLIARPMIIAEHSCHGLFHLSYPCSGSTLIGAVEMLMQMQVMNHPQRTEPERQLVEHAKSLLMTHHGMSEPEAHHHMQTYAMSHGLKMTDYARQILEHTANAAQSLQETDDILR